MKTQSVFDKQFAQYGKILQAYDLTEMLKVLGQQEKPADRVVYVPSCPALEQLPIFSELSERCYGGMSIQIGYCNGYNTTLNCLEYHRNSEVNISTTDVILLLGKQTEIDYTAQTFKTDKVEAFFVPAGTLVEVYATSLHYAPCTAHKGESYQVAIILPKGTNCEKPFFRIKSQEDAWMTAANKWLIAHPNAGEAADTPARLIGENINVLDII